jgi:kynurenine formamidase
MTTRSEGSREVDPQALMASLKLPSNGKVYDLSSGWWRGMPMAGPHPRFELLTYRSPHGQQVQQDVDLVRREHNPVNYGFASELLLATMHSGTHIDALCHVTCGPRNEWHGGSADDLLGDFGALARDASELPPLVTRGVMLDIPGVVGCDVLPAHFSIDSAALASACERQAVSIETGDVVLVRTGQMRYWPDEDAMARHADAGVSLDGARWLSDRRPCAVGADTVALEVAPSGVEGEPQPVHIHLIRDNGIPIIEWVNCEGLAEDGVFEFLFIGIPLSIQGATGSMLRPIAIV